MKIIFRLCILSVILTSCSHWNWVFKHEQEIKERICTPDTLIETIVRDTLIPLLQIDTGLLRVLNEYEIALLTYSDSLKTIELLKAERLNLLTQVKKLKQLAANQKVRVVEIKKPYPVYIDKQSTLIAKEKALQAKNKLLWATIVLSFITALLLIIIVLLIKRK